MIQQPTYIDLFAGPGFYNDNNPSTPILIAKHCAKDVELKDTVKMIFNDDCYFEELEKNFEREFEGITFKHKPHFGKSTVGENPEITKFLTTNTQNVNGKNEYPSLLFIDPFGYKGIETKVLDEFLKNWGNEIFLFVNTKRIHPALENDKFEGLMYDLFPTTLQKIKTDRRFKSTVSERLNLIIDSLGDEYINILGSKIYYTAFKFQEEDVDATSHFILHLTKGSRGYDLIKTIYNDFANVGTVFDGQNTYTFDAKTYGKEVNELFDFNSINIDKLKEELFTVYKGKCLTAFELFEKHHIKNTSAPYSRSHYTEALRRLVSENKLISEFTDGRQHKVTVLISKDCKLKFN
jgi:three-Cys-motif partner protein